MAKAVRKSLSRQVADMIEGRIRNDEYPVGCKLPTEPALAEMFGVSRNTVREAVQSLTHSGLLDTKQGDGTYVIAKERLQVDFYQIMSAASQQNILEVRDMMERYIVVSAIRNRTDEDLHNIETRLNQRNQSASSIREATKADLDFHIAVAEATHNDIVLNIYRYVSAYFNEFIYEKLHHSQDQNFDELHAQLYQAIREQNPALALSSVNQIIEF